MNSAFMVAMYVSACVVITPAMGWAISALPLRFARLATSIVVLGVAAGALVLPNALVLPSVLAAVGVLGGRVEVEERQRRKRKSMFCVVPRQGDGRAQYTHVRVLQSSESA